MDAEVLVDVVASAMDVDTASNGHYVDTEVAAPEGGGLGVIYECPARHVLHLLHVVHSIDCVSYVSNIRLSFDSSTHVVYIVVYLYFGVYLKRSPRTHAKNKIARRIIRFLL